MTVQMLAMSRSRALRRSGPVMEDYPVLGGILFVSGLIVVAIAYSTLNPLPLLILGHILALNGAFWVILSCRKREMPYGGTPQGR